MVSFRFPLSFFWGEKGLKLARGAVVSATRGADLRSFGGFKADGVARGGVDGGSLRREVKPEDVVAALESFL